MSGTSSGTPIYADKLGTVGIDDLGFPLDVVPEQWDYSSGTEDEESEYESDKEEELEEMMEPVKVVKPEQVVEPEQVLEDEWKNYGSGKKRDMRNTKAKADAATALRNAQAKANANGGEQRNVKGTGKLHTNGKALAPPYQRPGSNNNNPLGKASTHMNGTSVSVEIDTNIKPESDRIFRRNLELVWQGTGAKVLGAHKLNIEKLKELFTMSILSPDKNVESQHYYGAAVMRDFFLNKICVTKTYSSTQSILGVTVKSFNGEGNDEIDYFNRSTTVMAADKFHHCLVSISPNTTTYGDHGRALVDNTGVMDSRTFHTFGHLDAERINQDLEQHPSDNARLLYPADSVLGKLIMQPQNKKLFEDNNPSEDPITLYKNDINKIDIGLGQFSQAKANYEDRIFPLMRGKHNLDFHRGLSFELSDFGHGHLDRANLDHIVSVTLEITYTFSKGTRDGSRNKQKKHPERLPNAYERYMNTTTASGKMPPLKNIN